MQGFMEQHPALFGLGFAAYFVLLWVGIGFIVPVFSGWRALAQRYRTDRPFPEHTRRMQSGQMRSMTNYGRVLILGSDSEGLYLGVMFLFRIGHAPLFIPWQNVEFESPPGGCSSLSRSSDWVRTAFPCACESHS